MQNTNRSNVNDNTADKTSAGTPDEPSSSTANHSRFAENNSKQSSRLSGLLSYMTKVLPWNNSRNNGLRDTFEELIEEHEDRDTTVDAEERTLLSNVLQTASKEAVDIMVPRGDIVAFDVNTPLIEMCRTITERPYSRYPIYDDMLDNIVGFIHIKDILAVLSEGKRTTPITEIMRDVIYISPGIGALDIILEMRMHGHHMALVVDEYGGVDGLITLTDLVEEIVGEIDDEHLSEEGPRISQNGDGSMTADARFEIEGFEEIYGAILSEEEAEEDIETLAGLVVYLLGRVPARGEIVHHKTSGIEFEVLEADPRRVRRLRLRNINPDFLMNTDS